MSCRWALFLSGKGSTAQALLDLLGDLDLRLVVSSRSRAYGLVRARRQGLPHLVLSKDVDWSALSRELKARGVERLALVGFMKLLPSEFLRDWQGRVWNVHPSLLPAFAGAKALERSFAEKAEMGVTLHEVTPEMDAGRPVLQASIGRPEAWDDAQLLTARLEHRLLRENVRRQDWRGPSLRLNLNLKEF